MLRVHFHLYKKSFLSNLGLVVLGGHNGEWKTYKFEMGEFYFTCLDKFLSVSCVFWCSLTEVDRRRAHIKFSGNQKLPYT